MSTLQVTFDGRNYTFAPGATVRIGRSAENDIVVNDPTVSRRHAQLSWETAGWVWQNAGQSPTFLAGQPVAQFAVSQQVDVRLASPQGPVLYLSADAGFAQGGPGGTERAVGVGHTNLAGQGQGGHAGYAPGPAAAQAPAAAPAPAAAAAAAAAAGYGASPGQAAAPQGYPGAAPPGMPGHPGDQGYQGAGYQAGQ